MGGELTHEDASGARSSSCSAVVEFFETHASGYGTRVRRVGPAVVESRETRASEYGARVCRVGRRHRRNPGMRFPSVGLFFC